MKQGRYEHLPKSARVPLRAWMLEHDSHGLFYDTLVFLPDNDAPDVADRGVWVRVPWLDQPEKP